MSAKPPPAPSEPAVLASLAPEKRAALEQRIGPPSLVQTSFDSRGADSLPDAVFEEVVSSVDEHDDGARRGPPHVRPPITSLSSLFLRSNPLLLLL